MPKKSREMPKSKRLMELMMTVNRMRKFNVGELAEQFGVSRRTILRDLQELGELGVPLYSEVGPHGGYQVLNERVLPPIAFTEEEAVSLFFASHALRHYAYLPFEAQASAALGKFYHYMSGQVRDRIDQMKNRVDFFTPMRLMREPGLGELLQAAIGQQVLSVEYESKSGSSRRDIQPIGIYASNGLWYCPAYCFSRGEMRLFRCDRITLTGEVPAAEPLNLQQVHLDNWSSWQPKPRPTVYIRASLTRQGVLRCRTELWPPLDIQVLDDGEGWLEQQVPEEELPFYAGFFVGMGTDAQVLEPPELLVQIRSRLLDLWSRYEAGSGQEPGI